MNPDGYSSVAELVFSSYKRLRWTYNPSVKCLRREDSFTKESNIGNGLLDYPIGLITMDEVVLAGGANKNNNNYYLYINSFYWTMTPQRYTNSYNRLGFITNGGQMNETNPNFSALLVGLRPIISLKSDSSIASGLGTGASPYIIK